MLDLALHAAASRHSRWHQPAAEHLAFVSGAAVRQLRRIRWSGACAVRRRLPLARDLAQVSVADIITRSRPLDATVRRQENCQTSGAA